MSGLRIGTASAPVQIEGSLPPTNWHRWAAQGHIADGSTPEPTTDHWRRWREDNQLMGELGLQCARIGVEWARIEPRPGRVDHEALARYRTEIADLRERDIHPLVTLHHFGNPLWLEERGGWENPTTIGAFERFASVVVDALGDLVDDWITINEPNVYAAQGYLWQEAPPGVVSWPRTWRVLRHLAIAHCRVYRMIHDRLDPLPLVDAEPVVDTPRTIRVTFAHHRRAWIAKDPRNPLHRGAVALADLLFHRIVENAFFTGRFHALLGGQRAARRHGVGPGEYADVIGLNYYSRSALSGLADGTLPNVPVTDLGWEVYPEGMIEALEILHDRYRLPIWITENGCADNGSPVPERPGPQPTTGFRGTTVEEQPAAAITGTREDAQTPLERFRGRFILEHLRAIAESDLPIEVYNHWCFVDNWEWSDGEAQRFGIVHLDHTTRDRTVKPSGRLVARLIEAGAITPEIWAEHTTASYPRST